MSSLVKSGTNPFEIQTPIKQENQTPTTIRIAHPNCVLTRTSKIFFTILGIAAVSLVVGLIILFHPTSAPVFFAILGGAVAVSMAYLIIQAIKSCKQNYQKNNNPIVN